MTDESGCRSDSTNRQRLLIVDDEPFFRTFLPRLLGDSYDVQVANGAMNALELLSKSDVDVLLTDWEMPVRDGIWLLKKTSEAFPEVRRVLMSGSFREERNDYDNGALCHAFLHKPFSKQRLVDAISSEV